MINKNESIIKILFTITLLITFLLIGAPITNEIIYPIFFIIDILSIITIILKKFYKNKIIITKTDIIVIILCLSTLIPYIFNTFVSLEGTIINIFKYFHLLLLYFLSKFFINMNTSNKKYLINTIIVISIFLVIFGLDLMTTKIFTPIIKILELELISSDNEIRMLSTFFYANTLAITLISSLFLTLGEYLNTKIQKYKILYAIILFLLEIGIILTYSRLAYIVFAFSLLLYIIYIKNKKYIIETIITLIHTGIIALIYSMFFMKLYNLEKWLLIWFVLLIGIILNIIVQYLIRKYISKIEKINKKLIIFLIITCLILGATYIIIGLQLTESITIPYGNNTIKSIELLNVEYKKNYDIKLDVEAISEYKDKEIFMIQVEQRNKYFDLIKTDKIIFGEFRGIKQIKIEATSETQQIFIKIISLLRDDECYIKVNKLIVNEKVVPIKYKILPTSLINKITNINLKTKSAFERIEFIKDGFKLIKNNWLFGIGGNRMEIYISKCTRI